jgi:hypothetical protein
LGAFYHQDPIIYKGNPISAIDTKTGLPIYEDVYVLSQEVDGNLDPLPSPIKDEDHYRVPTIEEIQAYELQKEKATNNGKHD